VVCHLPYGPTVLRHDIEDRATVSEAYPHLIFNQFETQLVRSLCCSLAGELELMISCAL